MGPQGCAVEGGAGGGELRREVDLGCNSVTAVPDLDFGAAMREAANHWEATSDRVGLRDTLLTFLRHLSSRPSPTG